MRPMKALTAVLVAVLLASGAAFAQARPAVPPADHARLVAAIGAPAAERVLAMQGELGLDPVLFRNEFGTIVSAVIDMVRAGITTDNALAILRGAFIADRTLQELATITAAMIDLHEVGATQWDIMSVFVLLERLVGMGISRALVLEEVTTITAAMADMLEAGISGAMAVTVLRVAARADKTLEELTTIVAAMIDLVERGLTEEQALARIQAAIRADPTLEDFDDLVNADGDDNNGNNGNNNDDNKGNDD